MWPARHEVLTADPLPRLRLPVFTCYGADPGTPLTWISRDSKEALGPLRVTQPTTQQLEGIANSLLTRNKYNQYVAITVQAKLKRLFTFCSATRKTVRACAHK